MIYTDTISLFDEIETTDKVVVLQYVLGGVYFERFDKTTLNKNADNSKYVSTLFVPKNFKSDDTYVDQISWINMSLEEKMNHFTFRPGQVISMYNGTVSYSSLNDIINNVPQSYRVLGTAYFDKILPHFEVSCG